MSSEPSTTTPEPPSLDNTDDKATGGGGLKMKIVRSKSTDSNSDLKHKIAKPEPNGLGPAVNTNSNNGSSNSGSNEEADVNPVQALSVECSESSIEEDNAMFRHIDPVERSPRSFTTKNVPVSDLFTTQASKYQNPCQDYRSPTAKRGGHVRSFSSNDTTFSSPGPPKRRKSSKSMETIPRTGSNEKVVQSLNFESTRFEPESKPTKKPEEKNPPGKMVDQCVGTSFGTITEPEYLGPCEPGTFVNLEGVVWYETDDGILVVNSTWRGKSYIGTLMDSTRHNWAPPRPNESNEDWDCRTRAGRAKRRSAAYCPDVSSPVNSKPRGINTRGRGGREATVSDAISSNSIKPASPRSEIVKSKDESSSASDETNHQNQTLVNPMTGLQVEITNNNRQTLAPCPISPILLECPEDDCNKKYKNVVGLRYHQSRMHGADCFDEDSTQSFVDIMSSKPPSPLTEFTENSQNQITLSNGEHAESSEMNGVSLAASATPVEIIDSDIFNERIEIVSQDAATKSGTNHICDRESVQEQKDLETDVEKNENSTSTARPQDTSSVSSFCAKGISVKRDIFANQQPDQPGLSDVNQGRSTGHKDNLFKLPAPNTDSNNYLRDGVRSPAYSDISDDSLSFSSTDFIDKLLKSTENSNNQVTSSGMNSINVYQPQNQQTYATQPIKSNISHPTPQSYSTQPIQSTTNLATSLTYTNQSNANLPTPQTYTDQPSTSLPVSQTYTIQPIQSNTNPADPPPYTIQFSIDIPNPPYSMPLLDDMEKVPEKTESVQGSLFAGNNLAGQLNTTSTTFINPYNLAGGGYQFSVNAGIDEHKTSGNSNILPSKKENLSHKNLNSKESSDNNPYQITTLQTQDKTTLSDNISDTNKAPALPFTSVTSQNETPRHSEQSQRVSVESNQTSNNTSSQQSTEPLEVNSKNHVQNQNSSNIQQSKQSKRSASGKKNQAKNDANSQKVQNSTITNRTAKDGKKTNIKQEPQTPSISRPQLSGPPSTPHYMSPSPYLNPTYGFSSPYSQYANHLVQNQAYNMPYYSSSMPRYPSMPGDQPKTSLSSNLPPQYLPSSTYGPNTPNFSAPNSLRGTFPNPQGTPVSTVAGTSSGNPPLRMDSIRVPGNPANVRTSAQTHFHTHHHTHLGLNYPVYAASYEGNMGSGQQSAAALLSYSARNQK